MKKKYDSKIVEYAKAIRLELKEQSPKKDFISSPIEFERFMEKEKLAKASFLKKVNILKKIAREVANGSREIVFDLDKLPPEKRRIAQGIINQIEMTIMQKTHPVYGESYQLIYKLWTLIALLLGIGGILFMGNVDDKSKVKKKEFINTIKNIGDPTKKTPKELMSWIKNIVTLIEK